AQTVPFLDRGLGVSSDEHGRFVPDKWSGTVTAQRTTRLTSLPGTTTSLTTSLPSRKRAIFSLPCARRSNSSLGASAAASIRSRSLPLTWTTSVTVSLL